MAIAVARCRCGDGYKGLGDSGELLVVADEATIFEDPREGTLDNPPARQHLEALGVSLATAQRGDYILGLLRGPRWHPIISTQFNPAKQANEIVAGLTHIGSAKW